MQEPLQLFIVFCMFTRKFIFYVLVPFIGNPLLAIVSQAAPHSLFAENVWFCYGAGIMAGGGSMIAIIGFARRRIRVTQAIWEEAVQIVALLFTFSGIYRGFGLYNVHDPLTFGSTLYFSITTWTTLGYGDFTPLPDIQLVAALEAVLGYVHFGIIIGLLVKKLPG